LGLGSAGLDVVAGVFGYLTALNASAIASSRADMIRRAADADARRYAEAAAARNAQRKVMYLASGVTLAGSPLAVLDKQAQLASEDVAAIRMGGDMRALDQETAGTESEMRGRSLLLGGLKTGFGAAASIYASMGVGGGSAGTASSGTNSQGMHPEQ
jgi:hypothetical protein